MLFQTFAILAAALGAAAKPLGRPASENASASLFGFDKDTGLTKFTDLGDTSATTTGFIFFGSMLFVDVDHKMEAAWTARPTVVDGQSLFEVGWNVTADDAIPVQLNTRAPMHE
ncbi:hypothetical protein PG994_002778 [Apiospora phragmitis]|uniref:Uncharacterized protein n=1 Tax=Apiospora phragmitis TaxID=2905665 RepID=A0ABR1W652_9PEZI